MTMNRIKKWLYGKFPECPASAYIRAILLLIFITSLGFTIYFPSIHGPFLFDDIPNITHSSAIRMTELSYPALKTAVVDGFLVTRPVANLSFALNYLAHQYHVTGYHIVNIFLHIITGFLLYLLFKVTIQLINKNTGTTSTPVIPLVAALIWFVHPLQSQSVAYIVQRMSSMAAMFYLLAMLLYVHSRLAPQRSSKVLLFILAILAALLALGSKESAATIPCFIFLYEWYFLQDLNWNWLKKKAKYMVFAAGPLLAAVLFFLGSNPFDRIMAGYQIRDFSLVQRLLTELRIIVHYISLLLWPRPSRLSLEHDISISTSLVTPLSTLLAAILLITLIALAVRLARRERIISFSIFWFLGNHLIESSFIGLELIFEHRNYLPSMFFLLMLVSAGDRVIRDNRIKILIAGLAIIVFSLWTYERSTVWADDETLKRDCAEKAPNDSRVRTSLGNTLSQKGQYAEAIVFYYQGLKIDPEDDAAYLGLGNTYFLMGQYDKAIFSYRKALLLATRAKDHEVVVDSLHDLALVLEETGRFREALMYESKALRLQPDSRLIREEIYELRKKIRAQQLRAGVK